MIALYLSIIDEDLQKNKFEKLYYRYKNLMYYIAFQVLKDERDSEDAVQEAFLRIAKNMDKIGDVEGRRTKNFVAIIVKREAMKLYDKWKKRSEVLESELNDEENKNHGETFFDRCKAEGSDKIVNELEYAINALPYKYSSIMVLKYVMGYSGKEISQITGLSETNVRQHLFTGRKMLEEMLKEEQ
ncbi:MAG: RNA polymerase sigma factor [Eubacterium sp.]